MTHRSHTPATAPPPPAARLRLFIALDPPEETRRALLAASGALRAAAGPAARELRWAGAGQLHLTLRFLGEVPEGDLGAIEAAVRGAAEASRPLDLEVRGAGAFPSPARARVVWLGCGGEVAALEALVADLSTRLARAGHAAEPRPFVPHLTLGRVRAPRGARGLADAIARGWTGPAIPWRAGSLTLFRSHLGPGGARHEPLLVAPLGAPGAAGPELRSRP